MLGTLKTQTELYTIALLPLGRNAGELWSRGRAWMLTYQILPHVVVVQELDSGLQAHCILAGSKRPGSGSPLILQPEQAISAARLLCTGRLVKRKERATWILLLLWRCCLPVLPAALFLLRRRRRPFQSHPAIN